MKKVVLVKDKRIEENFPAEWPTNVNIRLTDGRHFEKYIRYPKGDPENPLTWQQLSMKFQSLASRVLPITQCEEIIQSVKGMNSSSALNEIWKLTSKSVPFSLPAN
jgi:2-methylcitrate dehydratase PrpD